MYAYLDIETSWNKTITVIGIYRPKIGTVQLVAPRITPDLLVEAMEGVEVLFTYNGACFDLPVIAQALGVSLRDRHDHRDLLHDCRRAKLKGGLKSVEKQLGIHRDTDGVDGLQAMKLWAHHATHPDGSSDEVYDGPHCCEPLDVLLRYNREDCENLEILARKLGLLVPEYA